MSTDEDDEDELEIAVENYAVSGPKARRCVFLAMRYDAGAGYRPGDSETWIAGNDMTVDFEGSSMVMNGTAAWYTGIWATLEGSLFVTRHDGWIIRNRDIFQDGAFERWENDELGTHTLTGVHGLDGDNVFVWGHDPTASDDTYPASDVFRWDGHGWNRTAGPGFQIVAMHGTAPDDLWVGGPGGAFARWDGKSWAREPSSHEAMINSIFVAAPGEVYATATDGTVMERKGKKMVPIGVIPGADAPADVKCVAKWDGALWVGAGRLGVFRRVRRSADFECVKPNIDCVAMDAREELVACCRSMIAGTDNGRDWNGYGVDLIHDERAPYALLENLG